MRSARLGIPAYFHPVRERDHWDRLIEADPGLVVLNPASGVGGPDDDYRNLCRHLSDRAGLVAGYIDTGYATRPLDAVIDEACRWANIYGVRTVFADCVSSGPESLDHYRRLAAALHSAGVRTIVFNPGVPPHPGYLDLADIIITFEGAWTSYRDRRRTSAAPAAEWHLVHSVDRAHLDTAYELAANRGADFVFATDRTMPNPWNGIPRSLYAATP